MNAGKQTMRDESNKHRLWLRKIERLLNALRSDVRKKEVKMDEIEGLAFPCYSTKLLYEEIKVIIGNTRNELDVFAALLNNLRALEERFEAVLNDFDETMKDVDDSSDNDVPETLTVEKGLVLIADKLRWKEMKIRELERRLESFPSYSTKLLFHEVKSTLAKIKIEVKERESTVSIMRTLSQRFDAILNDVSNGRTAQDNETCGENENFAKNSFATNSRVSSNANDDQKMYTAKARKSLEPPMRSSPSRVTSNMPLTSRKSITRAPSTTYETEPHQSPNRNTSATQSSITPSQATRSMTSSSEVTSSSIRTRRTTSLPLRRSSNTAESPAPATFTYARKRTRGDDNTQSAPETSPNSTDSSRPLRKSKEEAIRVISDACQDLKDEAVDGNIVCEEITPNQLAVVEAPDESQTSIIYDQVAEPLPKRNVRSVPPKPGYLTCCICGANKYYTRVITRFGQYSCEPCYRQYVKFLKKPRQFYCYKEGSCKIVPVDVSSTNGKSDPCQACWLKACLEKYQIDVNLRELIISNYPPVMFAGDGVMPVEISEVQPKPPSTSQNEEKVNISDNSEARCIVCDCVFQYRSVINQNYLSQLFGIYCCDRCDDFLTECVKNGNAQFACDANGNCDISGENRCKGCWLQTGLKTFDFSGCVKEDEKELAAIDENEASNSLLAIKNGIDDDDLKPLSMDTSFTPTNGTIPMNELTPVLIGNVRIYQCPVCGHQNKTKNNLQYHLASSHPHLVNREDLPLNLKRIHKASSERLSRSNELFPNDQKPEEMEEHN